MARALINRLMLIALMAVAPALHAVAAEPPPGSLYARMGGEVVVKKLVNVTIDDVTADHHLKRSFKDTNLQRIKDKLVEQICFLAGGACTYTGDPMREVHAGHQISESEFYGMVEVLRQNMIDLHIGLAERNELLALLAPMKRDVVDVPAPPAPKQPAAAAD
ncbi:MAG: group 1 truncated hemoglobin [Pseudomonadota bacterium]